MKNFIFGLLIGAASISYAVTPHDDGSVTFERGEMEMLRLQFYTMKMTMEQCAIRVGNLQQENEVLKKENDAYLKGRT